jgi:hypothetical protein
VEEMMGLALRDDDKERTRISGRKYLIVESLLTSV